MGQTTKNSKIINAASSTIYRALTTPTALEVWQAPNDMTAKVHNFDLRVGGGYEMSLFYSENETEMEGKTVGKEDRFTARFIDLIPNKKIVQAINFKSPDPAFSGEMIMEITIEPTDKGTMVTYFFQDIPKGIKAEDNEAGTIATLENLANYVEGI
jgi:uncharacterized protein YndB with AHSA1/START domain